MTDFYLDGSGPSADYNKYRTISVFFFILSVFFFSFWFLTYYSFQEKYIFYWDFSGYHELAKNFYGTVSSGEWSRARRALDADYGAIFALPHLVTFSLFGDSRLVFVATNVAFYQVPFCLAVGLMGQRLYPSAGLDALLVATTLAAASSVVWAPTLRGMPDVGGSLLLSVGLLIFLSDPILRRWRTCFAVGFLLALSFLFRRHFAYAAAALIPAMSLTSLVTTLSASGNSEARIITLARYAGRQIVVGITVLATAYLVAPNFLIEALTFSEGAAYASYKASTAGIVSYFAMSWGVGLLSMSLVGLGIAFLSRLADRMVFACILLFFLLWASIYIFVVRYPGVHYSLHVAPLLISLGTTGLILYLRGLSWRPSRLFVAAVFLLAGGALVYASLSPWTLGRFAWLAPAKHLPLKRGDFDQLQTFATYIAKVGSDKNVLVAASSSVLNDGIMRMLLQERDTTATVIGIPQVDSRDAVPISEFLKAEIIVLPDTPQYHMDPAAQDLVDVYAQAFGADWPIALRYRRLPEEFVLGPHSSPVKFTIYERFEMPDAAVVLDTIDRMAETTADAGTHMPAAFVVSVMGSGVSSGSKWTAYAHPMPKGSTLPTMVWFASRGGGAIPDVSVRAVDDRCRGLSLRDANGGDWQAEVEDDTPMRISASTLRPHQYASGTFWAIAIDGLDDTNASIQHCSTMIQEVGPG